MENFYPSKITKQPISLSTLSFTSKEKESNLNKNITESKDEESVENKMEKIDEIKNEKREDIKMEKTEQKVEEKAEENKEISDKPNDLKIILFPENKPKGNLQKKPFKYLIDKNTLGFSFDVNEQLGYTDKKVPVLEGFFEAFLCHYPIRIKPDDIWLLIVQAFSHHVNANSEELRNYFVNFDGKKTLKVSYVNKILNISQIKKKDLEDFSIQINEQMINYLGEDIIENLTPNFTTTNYDSTIICRMSIMGAFKKYFSYKMDIGITCGFPYIILEGSAKDYYKIKSKAKKLSKYQFGWYIDRILPIIEKMIEAKEDKIDIDFFKNMIRSEYFPGICGGGDNYIYGWILKFFAYIIDSENKLKRFNYYRIKSDYLENLAAQQLIVPFNIEDINLKKEYNMKYKVGFIGCKQNEENEVFPVQGWIVSPITQDEMNSIL